MQDARSRKQPGRAALLAALTLLMLALASSAGPPVLAQTPVSTHWTGWYQVYLGCKNDAQMHWQYMSNGTNRLERHYYRGRLSASTHDSWNVRMWGRVNWTTWDVAYKHPGSGGYFGPYQNSTSCGTWANGHVDHHFTSTHPSVTHDFSIKCKPNTSCADFGYWRRVGIGGGQGNWQFLFSGHY